MPESRWKLNLVAMLAASAPWAAFDAAAQSYPVKPVRIQVGFAAGSGTDIAARLLAQKLSEEIGQQVIVENRTGAGGTIATERVATAAPDGYTLLLITAADTAQPAVRAKLPYNLERDFSPVSLVANGPYVLVIHPSIPAQNVKALAELARAQPGKLSYGSSGVGSSSFFAGELFKMMANVDILHISYKGSSQVVVDNAGGNIALSFPGITAAQPMLTAGKLRALGVTGLKRAALMPSTPTIDEGGLKGFNKVGWYGIAAPAGISKSTLTQLNAAIVKVGNSTELKETMAKQGLEAQTNTPDQFAASINSEVAKNLELARKIGLKPE
jgi:tripartite-type tricarboxylate transporter receptor subunit TctC